MITIDTMTNTTTPAMPAVATGSTAIGEALCGDRRRSA